MRNMNHTREIQCPYCGETLEYATEVWEHEYELQRKILKTKAHKAFDAIWKSGIIDRDLAYSWLAHEIKVPYSECHFSNFSVEQLKQVLTLCELVKAKMLNAFCESNLGELGKDMSLGDGEWGRSDFKAAGVHIYTPED